MNELPQDFLAVLRLPVRQEADLDAQRTFFGRPEFQAFHADVRQRWDSDDVLRASAALLPGLHPHRAALLTLFCGALVEDGADPHLMFDAALQLMGRVLASLAPYCATEPREVEEGDEGEKGGRQDEEELAAWQAANAALEALAPPARFEVEALRAAVDLLVPPLMAMAIRDVRNHRALLADRELLAHLDAMYANDSLPFEDLHYLHGAASLSYEDELVVLLPTSRSGMIVRAHAVNNNFHAFSLLQDLMETHAQQLGIRQPPRTRGDDEGSDAAAFLWLQAPAFSNGELVNALAWSWGEGALRDNARRQGRPVLVALETTEKPGRSWNGFNHGLHAEQNPHVSLVRFLAPDEVADYLA